MNIINKIIKYLKMVISKAFEDNNRVPQIVRSQPLKTPSIQKCLTKSSTNCLKPNQRTKKDLADWIKSFNHTHFLTVQLPENLKISNFEASKEHLRKIMAKFENCLLGRYWNKRHLPFICFAEKGQSDGWHYHILFNANSWTTEDLQKALDETSSSLQLPLYSLKLQLIGNENDHTNFYCIKEIRIKENGNFDSDRIILSGDLFSIATETPFRPQ